jgi:hypothetical protein
MTATPHMPVRARRHPARPAATPHRRPAEAPLYTRAALKARRRTEVTHVQRYLDLSA